MMFEYENRFMSRSNSINETKEPYELIIDKNLRSRAKRVQDDTREELGKVLQRVENTLHDYERSAHKPFEKLNNSNIEFLVDINELQELLNDKIAKFKYKQRITVFIVGQTEAIERKNILLEQLNNFFNDQQQIFDPKELNITEFDFDLEGVKDDFEDTVETARIMGDRLEELNESIIQYLIASTSPKQARALIERTRKKLEKALKDAKDEISTLSERLNISQAEINIRDDKIKGLIKQLEIKSNELKSLSQKPKINADDSRQEISNEQFNEKNKEINLLRVKLRKSEQEIKVLNRKLAKSGIEIHDLADELKDISEEEKKEEEKKDESNDQITESSQLMNIDQNDSSNDFRINEFEIKEIDVLKYKYEQDITNLKKEYEIQIEQLLNKIKETDAELTKFKKKTKPKVKTNQLNKFKTKNQKKPKEKSIEIDLNEEAENLDKLEQDAEDEKQLKMLDDIENGADIEDIDLTTEDWVNVNPNEITKRYDMLRKYATAKINILRKNFEILETNDKEKIDKLKKQYFDHKKLWETEKLVLLNMKDMELKWDQERSDYLDQAEVAFKLQIQAQDAAENAIKQLEDFITEDAKLDRENAENTIHILRERSRTYTSLSMGNKEEIFEDEINNNQTVLKKLSTEKSEKIQVVVDNYTIKFPNKNAMDKIIDYINFESSNKYTLILSHAANASSRPNTRNEKTSTNSQSPNRNKSSLRYMNRETTNASVSSERKSSKLKKTENESMEPNGDLFEQVLTKVITDDEAMLMELRNTAKSRNSLRSKHLVQLEANKEKLTELKTFAAQKLIGIEQDVPFDDDLNRSHGYKRDKTSERIKMASESVLNRVSSSKTPKSSMNSSILSHPIFLEYIKVYDIVISFKNLIIKNLPASENQTTSYKKFYDRLNGLITLEYDSNLTATPQVINMTANIDNVLNEIKLIFSELIDENLSLKYDLLDKDHQLATRPSTGMNSEIDQILRVKELQMNEREEVLKKLEGEINHKLEIIDGKNLEIELTKNEYKNLLTKYESETKTLKDQINNYKTDIESLQNRNYELIRSKSFVLPPIKRKSEDSISTQFIMFTKLDAIQNEKRMRKGIVKGALTEQEFENAKILMDSYIRMQENRLVELVKFYVNSKHIQSIKENIHSQNEDNINTETVLKNIKILHQKKVNQYMEKLRKMRESRLSLASRLNIALDDIEQQSGIFLVKPFCSYKGVDPSTHLKKINNITRSSSAKQIEIKTFAKHEQSDPVPLIYQKPALTDPNILSSRTLKKKSWNLEESIVTESGLFDLNKSMKSAGNLGLILDTPKILEIDVNRVLIAQNQISSSVNLNEKEQNNVRTYLAYNRPNGTYRKEINQNSDIKLTRNSPSLPPIVSKKFSTEEPSNSQDQVSRKSSETKLEFK